MFKCEKARKYGRKASGSDSTDVYSSLWEPCNQKKFNDTTLKFNDSYLLSSSLWTLPPPPIPHQKKSKKKQKNKKKEIQLAKTEMLKRQT